MKQILFIFLLFLVTQSIFAQKRKENEYASTDKKALQIPDSLTKNTELLASYIKANFPTDLEKSRAIFIWVASNIQYDIDNMFALNFYEKKEDKIAKALATRKGICENYAALFTDICTKSGLKSFVVEGYTQQNGFTDYIPHAWCAARIDTTWFLFDPTWGSGYIQNGIFTPKINNYYFKAEPSTLIKSHMPFDYLWQLLPYPISCPEFYAGVTKENKNKAYFSFKDSIQVFEQQSYMDQLIASAYRVERNGVRSALVFDRLQHLKLEIERDKQSKATNLFNSAVADYNEGINALNEFIFYRNKQFTPKKTDPEIQLMLDLSKNKLKESGDKLDQIVSDEANILNLIQQLKKSLADASTQVTEQQNWLQLYFSKSKILRKSMFYTVTWYGLPLN